MELVKENTEKQRSVYKLDNCYKKVWHYVNEEWLEWHVDVLDELVPDYVQSHGIEGDTMYICFNIIPGTPASKFEHTPEFIDKIYNFCVNNINETSPYAHGDWVLSNIIIDGDNISMCDWDNVGIYNPEEVLEKLDSDLKSAFGDKIDTTSV